MNRDGLGFSKSLLESPRGLERLLLGFDQGEVAIIHTRTAHQSAHDFRRFVAQLFEKRLRRQGADQGVRNVGDNHILADGESNQSAAIFLGKIGDFQQLLPGHAAHGHGKPDIVESRLLLPIDPT